jgi:zinc transport system ATP-binding protein
MLDAADSVLDLEGVTVEFEGAVRALEAVSLKVMPREFIGLLGPNGAGKSTLLAVILGLQRPTAGHAMLFGGPPGPATLRRVGYVPQKPQPTYPDFPATVLETVLFGRAAAARPFGRISREERVGALAILEDLGIGDLAPRRISRLSGGQTQRVFVAKALAGKPDLLVLDEPTSGMDAHARREFYALLARLNREKGITVVLTSHDIHSVTKLATRIAFISKRIYFDGPPDDFAKHPVHSDLEDFPEAVMARK